MLLEIDRTVQIADHILVLGLGASGDAAARLARLYGSRVTVIDSAADARLDDRAEQLRTMGIEVCLEWSGKLPPSPDLAVISPGVPADSDLACAVQALQIPLISELEFGYRFCACPIIAVTGTNGKTTTVELLVHCLGKAGYDVRAAGNIGLPLSAEARRSHGLDFLVVEVSSFQLQHVRRFAPVAAAILNVSEDHLDRHPTFDEYLRTKLAVFRHLPNARRAVLQYDLSTDDRVRQMLPPGMPTTFAGCDNGHSTYVVSSSGNLCKRCRNGQLKAIAEVRAATLGNRHHVENVLAALALADVAGVDPETLASHISSFAVGEHRLETVAVSNNVRFVNDSKATNPDALRHALTALSTQNQRPSIHLIAGGIDKNATFAGLETVLRQQVKGVFLIGSSRVKLANQWGGVVSCKSYISLQAAFEAAAEEAAPGDVVLLAPGCASQDMFNDYAHRGRVFRELVERRLGE